MTHGPRETIRWFAPLEAPSDGPALAEICDEWREVKATRGWTSNGGPGRAHPCRANPSSLEIAIPSQFGSISAVTLIGVFALWSNGEHEETGTVGARMVLNQGETGAFQVDLVNGRHYADSSKLNLASRVHGDGITVASVGTAVVDGAKHRVDELTILLPAIAQYQLFRFCDLGTPASFVIFGAAFHFVAAHGCPFHSHQGGVALSEIGAIVRTGDRVRLHRAIDQLENGIRNSDDLDEARGTALTFIAVLTAATLEMGAGREMHRVQLVAARALDAAAAVDEVADRALEFVRHISDPFFAVGAGPSQKLINQALKIVERRFAQDISDAQVADELGLSTSHFRHLFREATGLPFHQFLIAKRLEKARDLLVKERLSVREAASSVGFQNASHFSRAFSKRFHLSPAAARELGLDRAS